MKLFSTNDPQNQVSFKEALVNAFPADKGLYVPEYLPKLSEELLNSMPGMDFPELAYNIAQALLGDEYSASDLKKICNQAFNFPVPLEKLNGNDYLLELFRGPTLAFKDFGARFMALALQAAIRPVSNAENSPGKPKKRTLVLTATSGDTGGAVASGFKGVENVDVIILYPRGRISASQRRQLSTPGENIYALALDGSFDDCQRIVKEAFLDDELKQSFQLCSANSINIGRLIPQSFYYFYAWSRLKAIYAGDITFCVPSGNFGNLTAGVMAMKMGLPVKRFIAACNENDMVPRFLENGIFDARPSLETLSSAMDVGNPSNFPRLLHFFNGDIHLLREKVIGFKITDAETNEIMEKYSTSKTYSLDPHTAVAVKALEKYRESVSEQDLAIILSTAHHAKFWADDFAPLVLPQELALLMEMPERFIEIKANLFDLKGFISNQIASEYTF